MATTCDDVWALLHEPIEAEKETERLFQEAARERQEAARERLETDQQIEELGRQIRRLGENFGGFTEGLALPSMERVLRERVLREGFYLARIQDQVFTLEVPDGFQPQVY